MLADLRPLGLRVALRSEEASAPADVLVVNTTGELREWYHLATVVFIGKSLTAHGGQNPVEPVLAGQPVVYGPNMENFAAIVARCARRMPRSRSVTKRSCKSSWPICSAMSRGGRRWRGGRGRSWRRTSAPRHGPRRQSSLRWPEILPAHLAPPSDSLNASGVRLSELEPSTGKITTNHEFPIYRSLSRYLRAFTLGLGPG